MSAVEERTGGNGYVGQAMRRREDPRFITGRGVYVDDIARPGMLHVAIVRSPEAHARDHLHRHRGGHGARWCGRRASPPTTSSSRARCRWPGRRRGWRSRPPSTGRSRAGRSATSARPSPWSWAPTSTPWSTRPRSYRSSTTRMPAVVDLDAGTRGRGRRSSTRSSAPTTCTSGPLAGGDVEQASQRPSVGAVERRIVNHRTAGAPIEPRAVVAEWHADRATLYTTTQIPHILRLVLAGCSASRRSALRVIAPDVGGGFGTKLNVYGEEALAIWLARKLNRPVRWTETRSEHMATTIHGRDQIDYVKLARQARRHADRDPHPRIAGLRGLLPAAHAVHTELPAFVMSGCYRIPNVQTDITGVFTNKFATDATRGAGRPEATHLIEVMMDQLAAELDMDPLELRRKNFIPKEDFPAEVALGVIYDSGDYHGDARQAARARRPGRVPARAGELREQGRPPRNRLLDLRRDLRAGALTGGRPARGWGCRPRSTSPPWCAFTPSGAVTVFSGASPHGQGLDTTMAQIVADRAGIHARAGGGGARRHRQRTLGLGHLRLALAVGGRRGRGARRASRFRTRPRASAPPCGRRRPRTSS